MQSVCCNRSLVVHSAQQRNLASSPWVSVGLVDIIFAPRVQPQVSGDCEMSSSKSSGLAGLVVIGGFVLIWSGMTLTADGIGAWGAVRQLQALSFPRAPGKVVSCAIKPGQTRGHSHVELEYTYEVAGVAHTGRTYRRGFMNASRQFTHALVDSMPAGKVIDVFYNPDDPDDAVLVQGIDGSDLFAAMALTPFNIVMLAFWAGIWGRWRYAATGGARHTDDGFAQRVEVHWRPLHAALLVAGVVAFALTFIVAITSGASPSLPAAVGAWLVIVVTAATVWMKMAPRFAGGESDLVVDRLNETVTLPVLESRKTLLTVPWSAISAIVVESVGSTAKNRMYVPIAIVTGGDGSQTREKLTPPRAEWSAKALAEWVRGELTKSRDVSESSGA
jgi:Protein of unknown function (DUF3592)